MKPNVMRDQYDLNLFSIITRLHQASGDVGLLKPRIKTEFDKCSSLAMLPDLLNAVGQKDDADWSPYINYLFVDVFGVDEKNL